MSLSLWTFQAASTGFPIGALTYREDVNSGGGTLNEDGSELTRTFVVDWGQWTTFVSDVLGYSTFGGATGVLRVLPEPHPDCSAFYASNCKLAAGVGKSSVAGNASSWTVARIETTYKPLTYAVVSDEDAGSELDRFVTRRTHNKGDYLQLQINTFKWVSRALIGGKKQPLGATPGIIAPSKLLEYTWHGIPAKPVIGGDQNLPYRCPIDSTIPLYLGCVNSSTFDGIYPAGTTLFVAADAELVRPTLATGNFTWTIKFVFEQKDNGIALTGETAGCNYLYDPANSRWDLVTTNGDVMGQRLYNAANLNDLFIVPVP